MAALCRECGEANETDFQTCPACGGERVVRHPELLQLPIAHLDCDAFYASIEKRDNPDLHDKPVIVGGRQRGVVAAACYNARTYGVRSAMPMFKALRACPHAVAVGRQVREMMEALTPLVEPLSIDEAFMDMSGTTALHRGSPAKTLARLVRCIEDEIKITVSIGLSYNKYLAKIASDLDKPRGFAVIGMAEARTFLADKSVSMLWGVGQAMRRTLARDGITLIGELARLDEDELVRRYGEIGHRLSQCARGEDARTVDPRSEAKSVSSETTFNADIADVEQLKPTLWRLAESVSRRMKRSGIVGGGVTLKLKTAEFRIITRSRQLSAPTQLATRIYEAAEPLLLRETDGRAFRLIGIGAHDLSPSSGPGQTDLFGGGAPKSDKVEEALDAVRAKFGDEAIVKGRGFGTKLNRQGPSKN